VAAYIRADLSQAADISRALAQLAELPPVDVLVHSAGISAVGAFAESELDRQQRVLDVNLRAPLQITAGLLRAGRVASGGTLVFIASLSVFTGYPGAAVYAASKDGVAAYARSLRAALRGQDIHVITVYPGPTRTAHARRYSPDNRREGRRMPPDRLAMLIYTAVLRRQAVLVPGVGNLLIARIGRLFPQFTEYLMRKTILEKLPHS
jgi:short-subunit dehydrogenase